MPILLRIFNLSSKSLNGKLLGIPVLPSRLSWVRSVSVIPLKRSMRERTYADKDNVPDGFRIIYRAPMVNYIKAAKIVSSTTAVLVGGLALFKYATDNKYFSLPTELSLGGLVTHDSDIWLFAAGFIAINAALMTFITKYPLRIYKNDKKYLAIYEGVLPFGVNRHSFNQGEVKELNHTLNPWKLITYRLNNKISLLLLDYFKTPSEFHDMCAKNK